MSTIISEQSTTLPPIECAPWCEKGDGHPNMTHPDDQWCHSEDVHIDLGVDRFPPPRMTDGTYERDYMRVYVSRDLGAPAALVDLGHGEMLGQKLSATEARQLGETLLRAAELVEGATA